MATRNRSTRVPPLDGPPPPLPIDPPADLTFEPQSGDQDLDLEHDLGDAIALIDARYRDWSWIVYRLFEPEVGRKHQRSFVTKIVGPLDLTSFAANFGGGVFEFWGYNSDEGRLQLKKKITQHIEGPIRVYPATTATAPAAAPVAPAAGAVDPATDARLKRMEDAITSLASRNVSPPVQQGMTFEQMMQMAQMFRGPQSGEGALSPHVMLESLSQSFKSGIELAGKLSGDSSKSDTAVILETIGPSLDKLVGAVATRWGRSGPAPPPNRPGPAPAAVPARAASSATDSRATVLDDEPAAPAPPAEQAGDDPADHRWSTAVQALARAIEEQDDPVAFADALERILDDEQIDQITAAGTDLVLAELQSAAGRFPALASPEARPFVDQVLVALRTDDTATTSN